MTFSSPSHAVDRAHPVRRLLLASAIVAASVAIAPRAADAAPQQWLDGPFQYTPGLACVTWNPETEITSYTGYWGTTDASFPQVGDVSYVHALGAVVGNPCSGGDVIGFDFFLPVGATPAVTAQNPVRCIATRLSDGHTVTVDPNIHCGQAPSTGTYGGLFFGWATVPRGWAFEIQVPVRFSQALRGLAGPASEQLRVTTSSTSGATNLAAYVTVPAPLVTSLPVARSFALNQTVAFSGTSETIHSEGPFVQVAGSPTTFTLGTARDVNAHFTFNYSYPGGPSSMRLDVRFLVDGVERGRTRAELSATSVDMVLPAIPRGAHTFTIEVRSVLLGGPPTAVSLKGSYWGDVPATLSLN